MNTELLLKVKAVILEEPKRVDMDLWIRECAEGENNGPACKTVGCISGWAVLIDGMRAWRVKRPLTVLRRMRKSGGPGADGFQSGRELLALNLRQANALFFDNEWPSDLRRRLADEYSGTPEYAAVVAEAIDRFIACDGDWANEHRD